MKKYTKYYLLFALVIVFCFGADILLGSVNISARDIFKVLFSGTSQNDFQNINSYIEDIVFNFRLPKAITALLAGVGLSLCGLQMQTLFKNPLADPYILGVSAASGLGVALFVMGGSLLGVEMTHPFFQIFGIAGAAMAGAFALMMLIVSLSNRLKSNLSLLMYWRVQMLS